MQKDIIAKIFHKDVFIILVCNIYAGMILLGEVLFFSGYIPFGGFDNQMIILFWLYFITKLLILPIIYNFMEKKSKNELVQKFIYKLKNSVKFKLALIGYILLTYVLFDTISLFITDYPAFAEIFNELLYWIGYNKGQLLYIIFDYLWLKFILATVFGLFGSYFVLYFYWFVAKKLKTKLL